MRILRMLRRSIPGELLELLRRSISGESLELYEAAQVNYWRITRMLRRSITGELFELIDVYQLPRRGITFNNPTRKCGDNQPKTHTASRRDATNRPHHSAHGTPTVGQRNPHGTPTQPHGTPTVGQRNSHATPNGTPTERQRRGKIGVSKRYQRGTLFDCSYIVFI